MVAIALEAGQGVKFRYTKKNGEVKLWEGFVKRVGKSKAGVEFAMIEVFGKREIVPRTFHLNRMQLV